MGERRTSLERLWVFMEPEPSLVQMLEERLNISRITATLLVNRGINDVSSAEVFIRPALNNLTPPDLLPQIEEATALLRDAVTRRRKISIYGDYDVDGLAGTAMLLSFLKSISADAGYYIPHRLKEGYGLNSEAIRFLKNTGTEVIVTVDCGITNYSEVKLARELGMNIIITDHHEPPRELPLADAIVNPKINSSIFPFRELSGAGVAFYLAIALRKRLQDSGFLGQGEPNLKRYLDLVAIGTICDVVPLLGENRIFSRAGLRLLSKNTRPGIQALKEVSGIPDEVTCGDVGFKLGPRLNAGGRLSEPGLGLRLLLEDNINSARELAGILNRENSERQLIEETMLSEALLMIESRGILRGRKSIVLAKEGWHTGVMGIVASRLVDKFFRPVALISLGGTTCRGSARSIPGFYLNEALEECKGLLTGFGGHRFAAGFSIPPSNIEAFSEQFEKVVKNRLKEEDFLQKLYIDCETKIEDLTPGVMEEIEVFEPFGPGNPEPSLFINGMEVLDSRVVGNGHLMLRVTDGSAYADAVGFGMADLGFSQGSTIQAVFCPEMNEWNGTRRIRMRLKDIRQI